MNKTTRTSTRNQKTNDLRQLKSLKGRLEQDAQQYSVLRQVYPELPADLYDALQAELEACIEHLETRKPLLVQEAL